MGNINNSFVGLIFGCPYINENSDCPFKYLRKLELIKRLDEFEKLSENEIDELISLHNKCFNKRKN